MILNYYSSLSKNNSFDNFTYSICLCSPLKLQQACTMERAECESGFAPKQNICIDATLVKNLAENILCKELNYVRI